MDDRMIPAFDRSTMGCWRINCPKVYLWRLDPSHMAIHRISMVVFRILKYTTKHLSALDIYFVYITIDPGFHHRSHLISNTITTKQAVEVARITHVLQNSKHIPSSEYHQLASTWVLEKGVVYKFIGTFDSRQGVNAISKLIP